MGSIKSKDGMHSVPDNNTHEIRKLGSDRWLYRGPYEKCLKQKKSLEKHGEANLEIVPISR